MLKYLKNHNNKYKWDLGDNITVKVLLYKDKTHNSPSHLDHSSRIEKKIHGMKIQKITGICIKRTNKGLDSSFTIKHVVNNIPVQQRYPLYSPFILSIEPTKKSKKNSPPEARRNIKSKPQALH